jgi:hypothetical protein
VITNDGSADFGCNNGYDRLEWLASRAAKIANQRRIAGQSQAEIGQQLMPKA